MSLSRLILLIFFFIITGSSQLKALTNYCATPFTASSDGTTILYLTCKQVSGTTYLFQLDFNTAVSLTGDNLNIAIPRKRNY